MAENAEIKLNALRKWIAKLEWNFCEMNERKRETETEIKQARSRLGVVIEIYWGNKNKKSANMNEQNKRMRDKKVACTP